MKEATKTRLAKAAPWIAIPIVAAVAFGLGGWLLGGSEAPAPSTDAHAHDSEETIWTCAMHPQIRQTEPGQCPICGMDLIPVERSAGTDEDGVRRVSLSERAKILARVRTARSGALGLRRCEAPAARTRRLRRKEPTDGHRLDRGTNRPLAREHDGRAGEARTGDRDPLQP